MFLTSAYPANESAEPATEKTSELRKMLQNWQDWITVNLGPVLQAFVALQLIVYLMTLIFSYKELLGATPVDEPIVLTN